MSIVEEKRDNMVFTSASRLRSQAAKLRELAFVNSFQKDEWSVTLDELKKLHSLEDDWDGEGSVAPARDVVDGAITLAMSLREQNSSAPDRVIASVNGCIVFEWYTAQGFMEIEVFSPSEAEGTFIPHGTEVAQTFSFVQQ